MRIRIGTRGSQLARWQSDWVARQLGLMGYETSIQVITTKGDVVQDRFDKMEGKGFFTKELEDALLNKEIDVAVHSLKDLPTQSPVGLKVAAIPEREVAHDLLISRDPIGRSRPLLKNVRIGTSSMRRVAALSLLTENSQFQPIRGNVPTRLRKLAQGEVDAILLAAAGVKRLALDMSEFNVHSLSIQECPPAPGQGALGIQTRSDYAVPFTNLNHVETARCVTAERWILAALDGGCQLPLGVHIRPKSNGYELFLFMSDPSNIKPPISLHGEGSDPQQLAEDIFQKLRKQWLN